MDNETGNLTCVIKEDVYRGNLLPPFSSISEILQDYITALEKAPYFETQISLFKEAVGEKDYNMKYFKHWSLLVVMATSEFGLNGSEEKRVAKLIKEIYRKGKIPPMVSGI